MLFDIDSDNILRVNGTFLQARQTSPDELYTVLVDARSLVERTIQDMYEELVRRNEEIPKRNEELKKLFKPLDGSKLPNLLVPLTIQRGSVWVMRLAKDEAKVVRPFGLLLDSFSQEDRGVFTHSLDIQTSFRPYWDAVWDAGFRPEARLAHKVQPMNGCCLLVRIRGSR